MNSQPKQYTRNPNFIFRKIAEETILVTIHQDVADLQYIYTLNDVGAFLWECLAENQTPQKLEGALLATYEATPEQVAEDVHHFLQNLSAFGAVKEV